MKRNVILVVFIFFALSNYSFAQESFDVIYLKNGSMIKGTIIENTFGEYIQLKRVDNSIFRVNYDEILKITKEGVIPTESETFLPAYPACKNSMILFGGFAFSSAGGELYENHDGDSYTTIQFSPSISYFIAPGFAIGGKFIYQQTSQGYASNTLWAIGPQIAYFIGADKAPKRAQGTTYPYLGLGLLYTNILHKYDTDEYSITGTSLSFGIGMNYMITNSVGLFTEFGYQADNLTPDNGESVSGNKINLAVGISAFIY
jgi:hypothetical protein